MAWGKREAVTDLVVLGDGEGNAQKAGGLLAAIMPDRMYDQRHNYELVQKDGSSIMLAGSASLSRQIGVNDIGRFVKCTFKGWGKSSNGRFKEIEVLVWEDEATDDMKRWPRYEELQHARANGGSKKPKPSAKPAAAEDDDFPPAGPDEDDLPF